MFYPLEYDDQTAINRPALSKEVKAKVTYGTKALVNSMACRVAEKARKSEKGCVLALDGYVAASFEVTTTLLTQALQAEGMQVICQNMEGLYLSQEEIGVFTNPHVPQDNPKDPVSIYGSVYKGTFADFIDKTKADAFAKAAGALTKGQVMLLVGYGSASQTLLPLMDRVAFIDTTPKTAHIRVRKGHYKNIGDVLPRSFEEIMRRCYFVDFEIILKSRRELLQSGQIDYYISGNDPDELCMMPTEALDEVIDTLFQYPFRCKPVYMEGVWGGEYMRKLRGLPAEYKNIAWVYEMIAFEVSVVIDAGGNFIELPFSTCIQRYPVKLMGQKSVDRFGDYFPIRFNYDDTWHGAGGMSIQVHPGQDYAISEHGDHGSQDEAYYVVAAGHGAKTFVGFREGEDPDELFRLVAESEQKGTDVDYMKYVNYIESAPGRQVMLPGGTIHASGRNQLVLELGSLTTGAYTYKMYDYNRKDLNGNQRPIHREYAETVIRKERDTSWVNKNIAFAPRLEREGVGYTEHLLGSNDLMYYETRQIDLAPGAEIDMKNGGQFTVLTLVDGEKALVYSKSNPDYCFEQSYLEIVIVPAAIDNFVIKNIGRQPIAVHKAGLK